LIEFKQSQSEDLAMDPGKGAGGGAHQEAVGRLRFRLSLTVAVLQLAVAVAGVWVALLVARQSHGTPRSGQRTTHVGSQIENVAGHSSKTRPAGPTGVYGASWPRGFAGYTVALASDIVRSDAVGAVVKARMAGLRQVGVLRSDRYASLTPGYWFVFSGVYSTADEARRELSAAVDAGFSDAYVRRVTE
jgi:hypothetical protein